MNIFGYITNIFNYVVCSFAELMDDTGYNMKYIAILYFTT